MFSISIGARFPRIFLYALCFGTSSMFMSQDGYLGTQNRKSIFWLSPEQYTVVMVHNVILKKSSIVTFSIHTPPKSMKVIQKYYTGG